MGAADGEKDKKKIDEDDDSSMPWWILLIPIFLLICCVMLAIGAFIHAKQGKQYSKQPATSPRDHDAFDDDDSKGITTSAYPKQQYAEMNGLNANVSSVSLPAASHFRTDSLRNDSSLQRNDSGSPGAASCMITATPARPASPARGAQVGPREVQGR